MFLLIPIKAAKIFGRLVVAAHLQQRTTAIMRLTVQSGLPGAGDCWGVATAKL